MPWLYKDSASIFLTLYNPMNHIHVGVTVFPIIYMGVLVLGIILQYMFLLLYAVSYGRKELMSEL